MGYLNRLYVVEKFEDSLLGNYYSDNRCFAEINAMFELGKSSVFKSKVTDYPCTDCYIYADDGNTRILEDAYGKGLKEIPIKDAINILKECIEIDPWWKFKVCLNMLEGFSDTGFVVLHYGH